MLWVFGYPDHSRALLSQWSFRPGSLGFAPPLIAMNHEARAQMRGSTRAFSYLVRWQVAAAFGIAEKLAVLSDDVMIDDRDFRQHSAQGSCRLQVAGRPRYSTATWYMY